MLKKDRNLTIFNQVISGNTLKAVASKHQISPSRVRNIITLTYGKICRELDIEPVSWSIYEMKNDGRLDEISKGLDKGSGPGKGTTVKCVPRLLMSLMLLTQR